MAAPVRAQRLCPACACCHGWKARRSTERPTSAKHVLGGGSVLTARVTAARFEQSPLPTLGLAPSLQGLPAAANSDPVPRQDCETLRVPLAPDAGGAEASPALRSFLFLLKRLGSPRGMAQKVGNRTEPEAALCPSLLGQWVVSIRLGWGEGLSEAPPRPGAGERSSAAPGEG